MQKQTRIALVVVAVALAIGAAGLHQRNAALERTLASSASPATTGGAP